eukprot:TRINITY_DN8788_c0_g2_i3.p1 TRINITY_DN8788_c0_g2~~TRINITY_DN8788_c0_g2_i3.p1  ORF type:complete len:576 (+),score=176.77 TRINITY_DN8788_c0_g2_i3:83-1729(+)
MNMIAEQIHAHTRTNQNKVYGIYFVPRRTMLCEKALAEHGVYGDVTTGEYHLDLIPFDEDILSMELDSSFQECFVDGDPTSLFYVAKSIMKLQSLFGIIPNIKGKGEHAHHVVKLMMRMRRELPEEDFSSTLPEIDTLILVDRNVDMITPLLTPHTYEGMIDEMFEIKNGYVNLDAEILGANPPPAATPNAPTPPPAAAAPAAPSKRKLALNSSDILFKEIRDMNFAVLGPHLHRKAAYVRETYEERHKAVTVSEIADFMKKFKNLQQEHQLLQIHINIAERISDETRTSKFRRRLDAEQSMLSGSEDFPVEEYVEECISKREPLPRVLRLLALLSLTNNGIKAKKYDYLKHEILQTYGFEYLFTLHNMERLGLIKRNDSRNTWSIVRRQLRLVQEEIDLKNSEDIATVFTGYAPLAIRLIECVNRPGWKAIEDVLSLIPGTTFEYKQELPAPVEERAQILQAASQLNAAQNANASPEQKTPLTLVFFVGGVTFAEISALRFLAQRDRSRRDYIVATTKLINGNSLINSVVEMIENNLDRATMMPTRQ